MSETFDSSDAPPIEVELATIEDGEFVSTGETIAQPQLIANLSQLSTEEARAVLADQEPYELNGFGD